VLLRYSDATHVRAGLLAVAHGLQSRAGAAEERLVVVPNAGSSCWLPDRNDPRELVAVIALAVLARRPGGARCERQRLACRFRDDGR